MDLHGDAAEDMAITIMAGIRGMAVTDFFLRDEGGAEEPSPCAQAGSDG
jgi:hypothetical protein